MCVGKIETLASVKAVFEVCEDLMEYFQSIGVERVSTDRAAAIVREKRDEMATALLLGVEEGANG